MKKNGVIVFDADGVILNWLNGMIHFLKAKGLRYTHLLNNGNAFYTFEEIFQSDDKEYIDRMYKEFMESESLRHMGRYKEESHEVLQDLAVDHTLLVLTCIGRTEHIVKCRTEEIHRLYPDCFSDVFCIEMGESKQESLEYLNDVYDGNVLAFFDDRSVHIKESELAGVRGYQYIEDSPECRIDSSLESVSSWSEIRSLFLS